MQDIKKNLVCRFGDRTSHVPICLGLLGPFPQLHVARVLVGGSGCEAMSQLRLAMPVGLNVVHSLVLFGSEIRLQCCMGKKHITSYKKDIVLKDFECE